MVVVGGSDIASAPIQKVRMFAQGEPHVRRKGQARPSRNRRSRQKGYGSGKRQRLNPSSGLRAPPGSVGVGGTWQRRSMAVVEVAPERCPNGPPFGPGTVVVGWHPCLCVEGHSGHRTYWCRTCGVTMYVPPHTP
jgi:hypothetical protein